MHLGFESQSQQEGHITFQEFPEQIVQSKQHTEEFFAVFAKAKSV